MNTTETKPLKKKILTPQEEVDLIRRKLGHTAAEAKPTSYLKTEIEGLNAVLGAPDRGIPYGRLFEISGWEGHGKSALGLCLMALAQKDGAECILGDFECSYDPQWVAKRGVDINQLRVFQPYVGVFDKEKTERLCTAEELCSEIQTAVVRAARRSSKVVVMMDSVAAMMPEDEAFASNGYNTRTRMGLPMLLSSLLRRWVGMAHSYAVLVIFINQLREKPMAFGDPAYTPGGKALKFYCHVRVRVNKVKGGTIRQSTKGGKVLGVQGVMTNIKNKVGGVQGTKVGYKLMFDGPVQFLDAEDMKREDGRE